MRLLPLLSVLCAALFFVGDGGRSTQAASPEGEAQANLAALTPEQAVQSFKQDPQKRVTVEFGIESAGWLDGPIRFGDDPHPPLLADWDGRLSSGGKFSLLLTAKALRGLKDAGIGLPPAQPEGFVDLGRLGQLCKHMKGKGVRVTGIVRTSRPEAKNADYTLVVDDPSHFAFNK
jgi:hypothetical protein